MLLRSLYFCFALFVMGVPGYKLSHLSLWASGALAVAVAYVYFTLFTRPTRVWWAWQTSIVVVSAMMSPLLVALWIAVIPLAQKLF